MSHFIKLNPYLKSECFYVSSSPLGIDGLNILLNSPLSKRVRSTIRGVEDRNYSGESLKFEALIRKQFNVRSRNNGRLGVVPIPLVYSS